jgi:protein-S-isoprenylcysteine O-methyltransferase Ste14
LVIISAIIVDFLEFNKQEKIKKKRKSIVATGTMFLFFFIFYLTIRFRIGEIKIENLSIKICVVSIGLAVLLLGTFVNIKGRINLGKNWANHIKIYQNHKFISNGVYKIVRHPLYASLIWIFYGACLIYTNYIAFLLNTFIFIPFMFYRAKQEESLLEKEFFEYKNYKLKTGMFFPKI